MMASHLLRVLDGLSGEGGAFLHHPKNAGVARDANPPNGVAA